VTARLAANLTQLRAASLAALPSLLQEWLPAGEQRGDEYVALNPNRNDRNLGSFRICTRTGRWRDHAIGVGGSDPISLYAYLFTNGDYRAAIKALKTHPRIRAAIVTGEVAPPAKAANMLRYTVAKKARVQRLWDSGTKLQGSPAATYLKSRGLRPNAAWDSLRASILPYPRMGHHPALIAPLTTLDGSLAGLHRTYLTPSGSKLDVASPRLSLGQVCGSAIRLGNASDKLIICEGLEDGLTLFQELGGHVPVWVAGGATFLAKMAIPESVRFITIAADNDTAGEQAAMRAADTHQRRDRSIKIMRPSSAFKDFNDELQGKTHAK